MKYPFLSFEGNMAKKFIRVFVELDYPGGMSDPSTEDGNPYKPTMILRDIVTTGCELYGYTIEEFYHGADVGFKLIEVT